MQPVITCEGAQYARNTCINASSVLHSAFSMLKACSAERQGCMDSSVCAQCVDDFFPTDDDDATTTTDDDVDISCADLNDGVCEFFGSSATCTSNIEYEDYVGEDLDPRCTTSRWCLVVRSLRA